MAEWLGTGLQNRLQQFDSAWYLKKSDFPTEAALFYICIVLHCTTISSVKRNPRWSCMAWNRI